MSNQKITKEFQEISLGVIQKRGRKKEELVSILLEINSKIGSLPKDQLALVSEELSIPLAKVFSVASFYSLLNTKPIGKHIIRFCESAPCHVEGGKELWGSLKRYLNIEKNETTPDGMWTLSTTSCIGLCDQAPVLVVDEDIYHNVTPNMIPEILGTYK